MDVAFEAFGTLGATIWPFSVNVGVAVEMLCLCCFVGVIVSSGYLLFEFRIDTYA